MLLRDLHPNAPQKWRYAVVSRQQGPMTYRMVVDSQTKRAHVDQLQPCPEHNSTTTQSQKYNTTESVLDNEHLNNALNPFLFVDHDGSDPEPKHFSIR